MNAIFGVLVSLLLFPFSSLSRNLHKLLSPHRCCSVDLMQRYGVLLLCCVARRLAGTHTRVGGLGVFWCYETMSNPDEVKPSKMLNFFFRHLSNQKLEKQKNAPHETQHFTRLATHGRLLERPHRRLQSAANLSSVCRQSVLSEQEVLVR